MDLEVAVAGIRLAGEQAFELALAGLLAQPLQRRLGLGEDRLVAFGFRELDQAQRVVELALDRAIAPDAALKPAALAQQLLRLLGLAPELGVFGERVQLGEAADRVIPVKDASSAGPTTV
jgi:hypothetical protein